MDEVMDLDLQVLALTGRRATRHRGRITGCHWSWRGGWGWSLTQPNIFEITQRELQGTEEELQVSVWSWRGGNQEIFLLPLSSSNPTKYFWFKRIKNLKLVIWNSSRIDCSPLKEGEEACWERAFKHVLNLICFFFYLMKTKDSFVIH